MPRWAADRLSVLCARLRGSRFAAAVRLEDASRDARAAEGSAACSRSVSRTLARTPALNSTSLPAWRDSCQRRHEGGARLDFGDEGESGSAFEGETSSACRSERRRFSSPRSPPACGDRESERMCARPERAEATRAAKERGRKLQSGIARRLCARAPNASRAFVMRMPDSLIRVTSACKVDLLK